MFTQELFPYLRVPDFMAPFARFDALSHRGAQGIHFGVDFTAAQYGLYDYIPAHPRPASVGSFRAQAQDMQNFPEVCPDLYSLLLSQVVCNIRHMRWAIKAMP